MNFSSYYEQSNGLVRWSPNGAYLAVGFGRRIIVKYADTLAIAQIYSASEQFTQLEW